MRPFLVLLFLLPLSAQAFKLHYFGETEVPHNANFRGTKIGGLSAIIYHAGTLWALSDDKGSVSEPRYYEFDLKVTKDHVRLSPKEVHSFHGFPAPRGEKTILDTEAFVRLDNGDFLISSEGNNDRKPRILPRLFRTSADAEFKADISLPDKFIPELLGQQTKGLQTNAAFEGLTQTADGRFIFAGAEDSIVTDFPDHEEGFGHWVRFVKFANKSVDKSKSEFPVLAEYAYRLEAYSSSKDGREVFRGCSEILAINEKKLLVLERGVRLSATGWKQTVALYLADLSEAQDVSLVKNLGNEKVKAISKTKILDFETDLQKQRPPKKLQNFEGLAWGPTLPDGKKSLLIISDNNFSKKERTELLVFSVEAE